MHKQALDHPYLESTPAVYPLITEIENFVPVTPKSDYSNMKVKGKADVKKLILSVI